MRLHGKHWNRYRGISYGPRRTLKSGLFFGCNRADSRNSSRIEYVLSRPNIRNSQQVLDWMCAESVCVRERMRRREMEGGDTPKEVLEEIMRVRVLVRATISVSTRTPSRAVYFSAFFHLEHPLIPAARVFVDSFGVHSTGASCARRYPGVTTEPCIHKGQ